MKSTLQIYSQDYSKLIGTPYSEKDCWGIAVEFYRLVFGIELKSYYSEVPQNRDIAKSLIYSSMGDFTPITTPEFGDLILIKLYGVESHIAIYLGNDQILHTHEKAGCIIDRLPKWKHLIVGFYRITDDTYSKKSIL